MMGEIDQDDDQTARAGATKDTVGDVETAGETTAAVAISGPADTRPVGADTLVKVAGERVGAAEGDG